MSEIVDRRWGPWILELSSMTLVHDNGYDVRLRDCATSSGALDWLGQICGKDWGTAETLGSLVRAMNDLLSLQENLCGCGLSRTIEDVDAVVAYQLAYRAFLDENKPRWTTVHANGGKTVDMGAWIAAATEWQAKYRQANGVDS